MTFTATDVQPGDAALIDALYELGRTHPLDADVTCTSTPHPLRAQIAAAAEGHLLALYDDGVLRAGVGFDDAGVIGLVVFHRYSAPGQAGADPRGNQFAAFMVAEVSARVGACRSASPNSASIQVEQSVGIVRS